jgi:hypothetical protein
MGGGGGNRYTGPTPEQVLRKVDQAREKERERLNKQVNDLLESLLARFNDRDTAEVSERLERISELLGEVAELDTLLLGGSVAKHTAVNGLSDVDALVILDRDKVASDSPESLIDSFHDLLWDKLPRSQVEEVDKGRMAVTVRYLDTQEIQLLPALRSGQTISIAGPDGKSWHDTKPRLFQRALTSANAASNQALVPTIKLVKSIVGDLPPQKQLTGYHIESLAVDAAKNYDGVKIPRALLLHVLGHSASRVLRPIADVTGQSRTVDAYLGDADSTRRRNISQALSGVKRRLETAATLGQWRAVLSLPEG